MSHTKAIKLGRHLKDMISPMVAPETDYPRLHLDDLEDDRLGDLEVGKKGTAEIEFKVVSKSHREDGKGKRHSVVLEITSIEPGHDPKFNGKKSSNFIDSAREGFKKNFK